LAEYFSGESPPAGVHGNARLITVGSRIFHEGIPAQGVRTCAGCHGGHAEGASVFPRLAGQNADYVLKELKVFQTRLRPHGILMKNETANLTAEELQAVSEYVQSQ
jgi:cytochrome c553